MTTDADSPAPPAVAGPVAVPGVSDGTTQDAANTPVPLRQRTLAGFVWVTVSVMSNKFIGFASQLVLARWLSHDDFGLIALALAAATFALLLREAGVTQVLVQRGNRFDEWAGPAFGLITSLCALTGLLLAGFARPLANWYGDLRLVPMLYVIAATCPLAGLGNVALARLEHDLRFREIGLIATFVTVVQYAVQTVLAVSGFGAMSFVWGIFISTALRLAWLWTLCRPTTARFFDIRAWRALLADSVWVFGVGVFGAIVGQYDRVVLGKTTNLATVGLYFFAFNLTTQTSQMLSGTLGNVLFPALSRLSDRPERQRDVFMEIARLLSCVAMPLCVLQVVLARPFVALFGGQWAAAVPLVQVLSVGMAFVVCASPAVALLQAQGRFRSQFIAQVLFTLAYLSFVTVASLRPGNVALSVAVAVSLYYGIFGPVGVQLAVKNWAFPWIESVNIFVPGAVIAGAGLTAAVLTVLVLGNGVIGLAVSTVVYGGVALLIFLTLYRDEFRHARRLVGSVLRRKPTAG